MTPGDVYSDHLDGARSTLILLYDKSVWHKEQVGLLLLLHFY